MQLKTNKIKAALSLLAKIDGETMEQKAAALGVHRTTLWRWRKKPEMQDVLDELADSELQDLLLLALGKLRDAIEEGNVAALRLYFQVAGFLPYREPQPQKQMDDRSLDERIQELIGLAKRIGFTKERLCQMYDEAI